VRLLGQPARILPGDLAAAAGLDPPVYKWNPHERAEVMAELDAAFFLLYGIDREDAEYILGTFSAGKTSDEQAELFLPAPDVLDAYDCLAADKPAG